MGRLDEIRARLEAATPGPWETFGFEVNGVKSRLNKVKPARDNHSFTHISLSHDEDAEFIAHAPEDIAYLLAEIERLTDSLPASGAAAVAKPRKEGSE